MEHLLPTRIFLTKGFGKASTQLGAFEYALRNAGIAPFNLVRVSSIIPPNAKIISREEGLKSLQQGQILFLVLSRAETNEPGREAIASIGMAFPKGRNAYGYLSEYEAFDENEEFVGKKAESLAASMLASIMGYGDGKIVISEEENEDIARLKGIDIEMLNITQEAKAEDGKWACAIAAAVLI
ncbi:MAG: pyruvoyl-dependent arginine decarboxylase [Candidatus Micrarchaeia archaeon]